MNRKDIARKQAIATYWVSEPYAKRRIIDLKPDHAFYILRQVWNFSMINRGVLWDNQILLHAGYNSASEMPSHIFETKDYRKEYLANLVPALMYCTLENYNLGKLGPFAHNQFKLLLRMINPEIKL